jgi:cell division protein ZapE
VHFHAFMEELHRRLHAMPPKPGEDYVATLATEIAAEAVVLGFDEFYLTNLPDAMLLGRLVQHLFRRGVVLVATSNWALPELFQGGLHRDRFMPLLRAMEGHLDVIDLGGIQDYRRVAPATGSHANPLGAYVLVQAGESASAQLETAYHEYAEGPGQTSPHWLQAKRVEGRVVWATFEALCGRALGRQEYRELAGQYHTIMIEGIPALGPQEADAALRLAVLVDILYEHNRRLVVSAAVAPDEICQHGAAAEVFARTASRLVAMTGYMGQKGRI